VIVVDGEPTFFRGRGFAPFVFIGEIKRERGGIRFLFGQFKMGRVEK
jgi:hypothetical protein